MNKIDEYLRVIEENSDLEKNAEYIIEYLPGVFEFSEAKEVAKYLVNEFGFSNDDILRGKADDDILLIANVKKIRNNSVQRDNKKERVPFKTKKKSISKKIIAISLAVAFSLSSIMYISHAIEDGKEDYEISSMMGLLAQGENEKGSIINQNTYGIYQGPERNIAYKVDGIANDILKICTKNPELLDLTLYRTYFDMYYNRLDNMDDVIKWIKKIASEDDSLSFINDRLEGTNVFLDYVLTSTISSDDEDYEEYKNAIDSYKNLKENNNYAYNVLSEENQDLIDKLISEFENKRESLYTEYKDDLESLISVQGQGGRK